MIFIDTNFFLRFFLKDIKNQYLEAKNVFEQGAKGEKVLITSTIVIFEIFWVLNSYYHYSRSQIAKIIGSVLDMTFIRLEERSLINEALILYQETNLSLGDCYNVVYSKMWGVKEFKTFDIKLERKAKAVLDDKN